MISALANFGSTRAAAEAALIKARTVAGDLDAGRSFLKELEPYIWRRNLDFAAIADRPSR